MGKALEELIAGWRNTDLTRSPYLFAHDLPAYEENASTYFCHHRALSEYTDSDNFADAKDSKFHVGLYPQPFFGNLQNASVFLLMLNPGLSASDYFAEERCPEYRAALGANLYQENEESDYPFFFLDPQFAWLSGFEYFHSRLREVLQILATKSSYSEALRHVARNLACLQLIPYHSKSLGAASLIRTLPSTQVMLNYVQEDLSQRAEKGEVYILVLRREKTWGLSNIARNLDNVSVYKRHETRAAYLKKEDIIRIADWLVQRL
jgi:hypothetical protein